MKVGSLFAGIGGFDLGLERAGFEITWQVEIDPYCQRVLAKHWPHVTRYGDIRAIDWATVEPVDIVCGGFPCQPFSFAGKRAGKNDDRYLWPEVVRCLDALRPAWFIGENVPGIINLALDQVCADLESLGYAVWPVCIPACAVDSPHQRQRVWIVAHAKGERCGEKRAHSERSEERTSSASYVAYRVGREAYGKRGTGERGRDSVGRDQQAAQQDNREASPNGSNGRREDVADAFSEQSERGRDGAERRQRGESQAARDGWSRDGAQDGWWQSEPDVGRVAHGVPHRVDRLRGLGNAIVPQIAEVIGRAILHAQIQDEA